VVQDPPRNFPISPLSSPVRDDLAQSLPIDTGGVIIPSSPNHFIVPDHCSFAPLPLVDPRHAGTESLTKTTLAHGLSITRISHLTPTFVEMMHLVPIPTYLGKSHIICDSRDLPSSSHRENFFNPIGKDFSWSRGLGIETSPIKTRSAQRKTRSSVTHPTVTSTDTSDLGVLRGIKSLARSRP